MRPLAASLLAALTLAPPVHADATPPAAPRVDEFVVFAGTDEVLEMKNTPGSLISTAAPPPPPNAPPPRPHPFLSGTAYSPVYEGKLRALLDGAKSFAGYVAALREAGFLVTRRVKLVEGREQEVAPGVRARLKGVLYAHIQGGRNNALVPLVVTRAGHTKDVTLTRDWPGAPKLVPVEELQMAIDDADAYAKPSTATLLVEVH